MKTVRMKSSFAGQVNWPAGSIQEMDDDEAVRLVEAGYAEYPSDDDDGDDVENRATRVVKKRNRR